MRINVYAEEMTLDVEHVIKENVIGEDGQPTTFYGIRWFMHSSDRMHQTEFDDDRTAITFWFRSVEEAEEMATRFGLSQQLVEEYHAS